MIKGPFEPCQHVFNMKEGKLSTRGAQEHISRTIFGTMPPMQPPSGRFEQATCDINGLGPQIPKK